MCGGSFYKNLDNPSMITNPTNISVNAYYYLSTVEENSDFFTGFEVEGARKVRKLQQHIYLPGTSKFKTYLRKGMIHNCPINPEDSGRADHIYGPYIPLLHGGMKYRRKLVKKLPIIPLPTDISLHHKNI